MAPPNKKLKQRLQAKSRESHLPVAVYFDTDDFDNAKPEVMLKTKANTSLADFVVHLEKACKEKIESRTQGMFFIRCNKVPYLRPLLDQDLNLPYFLETMHACKKASDHKLHFQVTFLSTPPPLEGDRSLERQDLYVYLETIQKIVEMGRKINVDLMEAIPHQVTPPLYKHLSIWKMATCYDPEHDGNIPRPGKDEAITKIFCDAMLCFENGKPSAFGLWNSEKQGCVIKTAGKDFRYLLEAVFIRHKILCVMHSGILRWIEKHHARFLETVKEELAKPKKDLPHIPKNARKRMGMSGMPGYKQRLVLERTLWLRVLERSYPDVEVPLAPPRPPTPPPQEEEENNEENE